MARITKASLKEFAKEIAALEAAEATILPTEEMEWYSGDRYSAYNSDDVGGNGDFLGYSHNINRDKKKVLSP